MKTLKIQIPEGYEIDEVKSTFQEIVYKPVIKNIRERIQTMKDVFELNGTTEKEFLEKYSEFEQDEIGIAEEKLIVKAYNQGEKPNWQDGSSKYYSYFKMDEFRFGHVSWYGSYSNIPASLCFVGDEGKLNCEDAVNKFLPQYKRSRL